MTKKTYLLLTIIIIIVAIAFTFIFLGQREDMEWLKERQTKITQLNNRLDIVKDKIEEREGVLEDEIIEIYTEIEVEIISLEANNLEKIQFINAKNELLNEIDELENKIIGDLKINFIPEEGIESQEIQVVDRNDYIMYQLTLDELKEWLEDNWYIFSEAPEVGGRQVSIDNFRFFDRFASISPNNQKLIFSVHDYAVATSKTFVIVANIEDDSLSMLDQPIRGSIDGFHFADNSRLVAFSLSTARAGGDFLSVVDVEKMEKEFLLSEKDLLEIIDPEEQEVEVGQFMPYFRDLKWHDFPHGYSLEFTSNSIVEDEEEVIWLIDSDGVGLVKKYLSEL